MEWEISVRKSSLKPRYEGENYIKAVTNLSSEEQKDALKSTSYLPHKEKFFQDWIASRSLVSGIMGPKESTIQFVQRVYTAMVKDFEFGYPSETRVQDLLRLRRGSAEALCRVFVCILRANEILARVLVGRYASSKKPGQTVSWIGGDSELENEQIHAQAQFYLDDVGWIPVDIAPFIKNKNTNFNENKIETYIGGFGNDNGQFMAWSIDCPFVEVPVYGPRSDINSTDFTILFKHKKLKNSDWIVTS